MENKFKLTVRTPVDTIFNGEADKIHLNTEGGEIEVYGNHSSLTAAVSFSPIQIKSGDTEEEYLGRNGIFKFFNETNSAILLLNYCEAVNEVEHKTIKEYLEFIEKKLSEGESLSDFEVLYLKGEKLAVEENIKHLN